MISYSKEEIFERVREEDVEFIRLQFTDVYGNLKNVAITANQLERALNNECMFDVSSIRGFYNREESDMYLYPDLSTFAIFPWRPQQGKVARLICDVYRPNKQPFMGDPRQVLKKVVNEAKEMGYTFHVGPECEFFLFNTDEFGLPTTQTHEKAGYFDCGPVDLGENARRDIVFTLEDMGFSVERSHHEVAPAQHEVDFKYDEALVTADNIMTFRLAVKTVAKRHGLHATFMPKPKQEINGSGMHLNMSLHKGEINVFSDPSNVYGLSEDAYYFIGGIMEHIKAITLVTNPLVNSYKRLVPGYEAPVDIAWSASNRSPLLRIPFKKDENTRVELRSPDPSANPYLALAVCLKAGLEGIRNKTMPPESINDDLSALSQKEKTNMGIDTLPSTLRDAIYEFEKDPLMKEIFGVDLYDSYLELKKEEWNRYHMHVTAWETEEYLGTY
ncbi:MAG: type I glutamate--ammonia ligase [Lachnospiraceae bacterium]